MDFGLAQSILNMIKNAISTFPEIERADVFGSRATGTYKNNSDIDIALFGRISYNTLLKINEKLEELPSPYLFDIKAYNSITHKPLIEHIDKFGKTIYEKH